MIDDLATLVPEELLDQSGSVFYSGRNAFAKQADLYILGLNPGGDPKVQAEQTVGWHTKQVLAHNPHNWSAYKDDKWGDAEPGTCGMQPRVLHLLRQANLDPRMTPASNVVFVRSRRESTLGGFNQLADLCWPFHNAVIRRLKPRVILCFGKTAGGYVTKKLGATIERNSFIEKNKRRWRSVAYEGDSCPIIVVATHPSIAKWSNPASDPSDLVIDALADNVR